MLSIASLFYNIKKKPSGTKIQLLNYVKRELDGSVDLQYKTLKNIAIGGLEDGVPESYISDNFLKRDGTS